MSSSFHSVGEIAVSARAPDARSRPRQESEEQTIVAVTTMVKRSPVAWRLCGSVVVAATRSSQGQISIVEMRGIAAVAWTLLTSPTSIRQLRKLVAREVLPSVDGDSGQSQVNGVLEAMLSNGLVKTC